MTFCNLKGTTEPRICCIQRRGRETALSVVSASSLPLTTRRNPLGNDRKY